MKQASIDYDFNFWKPTIYALITSWSDHVFGYDKSIQNVRLLGLSNNFGDHRVISFESVITHDANNPILINQTKYYWV